MSLTIEIAVWPLILSEFAMAAAFLLAPHYKRSAAPESQTGEGHE